jgi:hypothetical protein
MAEILEQMDKPVIFLLIVTFGVIAVSALLSWAFAGLKWTGPLSLVKGGACKCNG